MKKIFILFCALIFSKYAVGQIAPSEKKKTLPSYSNEIGLNFFCITKIGKAIDAYGLLVTSPVDKTLYHYFPGIYYKRHFGKNAFRLSIDYFHESGSTYSNVFNEEYFSFDNKEFQFQLGYERIFGNRRFLPYIYSDLFLNYGTYYSQARVQDYRFPMIYYSGSSTERTCRYGLLLGAGVKYRFSSRFTLSYAFSASLEIEDAHNVKEPYVSFPFTAVRQLGLSYMF